MKNKLPSLVILLLLFANEAMAQKKFTFAYDGNGNRTSITYANTCGARVRDTTEAEIVDEKIQIVKSPSLYPNPAKLFFTVSFPNDILMENATLEIYNLEGNLVFRETEIYTQHTRVDVCNIASGMYIVKVDYGAEKPFITKLQKVN
jgi:hypothetical protein